MFKVELILTTRLPSHLLHEEVVHAAVVVGRGEDVQCVVLPLGGFQSDAADLHAATPPHLRRRLLVLLTVPDPPRGGCLQIWTVRRRRAFWDGHKGGEGGGLLKMICESLDRSFILLNSILEYSILTCVFSLCIFVHCTGVCVCVFFTMCLSSFAPAGLLLS